MRLFEKNLAIDDKQQQRQTVLAMQWRSPADLAFDGVPMSPETSGFEKCPQIAENQRHLCTETRHLKGPNEKA